MPAPKSRKTEDRATGEGLPASGDLISRSGTRDITRTRARVQGPGRVEGLNPPRIFGPQASWVVNQTKGGWKGSPFLSVFRAYARLVASEDTEPELETPSITEKTCIETTNELFGPTQERHPRPHRVSLEQTPFRSG